ncbi:MAG: GDSL-type esterase/lipase family protein [Prolixibacteraceae bacterium]|nr:GDSL-type esterase/lipase family protein [Prolixibacteraceae bacterium]
MNRFKILGIFFFCLITLFQLTGTAKNPNNKKLDLDIVFIGNSITYGANLENPKQDAPPVVASEILRKKTGISSVQFSNQGRSGFTTVNYLPDSPTFAEVIQATKLLHTNPEHTLIFSIKLGTNDSAISGPQGAPVSKEDYRKNMKAIIDELLRQFPDAKVVLQQPIWYSTNTYNRSKYLAEGLARLQSYFPELESLVKSYSATNKNQVFMGDRKGFNYFRKNYLTDLVAEKGQQGTFYLHPNPKGAAQLGSFWAEAIYKIVK